MMIYCLRFTRLRKKLFREAFYTLARLLHEKIALIEVVSDEQSIVRRLSQPGADCQANLARHKLVKIQFEKLDIEHLTIESKADNIEDMMTTATDYISRAHAVR